MTSWSRGHILLLVLTIAIAVLRVAATHHVFSATIDEQAHVASGYDWWNGIYGTDPTHPPLARMFFGLPLRILGVPPPQGDHFVTRGNELFHHEQQYRRNLTWARRGNLLFLALAIAGVALWSARWFGATTGCIAAFLFSLLPPILAHAGLATTDLAVAAALPFVVLAMSAWIERPDARRAAILGLVAGLGLLTKFSFIPFCAIVCLLLLAMHWRLLANVLRRLHWLLFAVVLSLLVVCAAYRFQFTTLSESSKQGHSTMAGLAPGLVHFADTVRVPAASYFAGVAEVALHDRAGHFAYLFGECRQLGWWYYFPVALFVKTPLPFLALALWGMRSRRVLQPLLIFLALLAYCMTSSINIGVRHVLPLYAPLAIIAASGLVQLRRSARRIDVPRLAAALLVAWLVVAGVLAHPDYLAWFNETAGAQPQRIVVDSNLDWGQDLKRLAGYLEKRGVERVGVLIATADDISRFGIIAYGLEPNVQPHGWIAVSHTSVAYGNCRSADAYRWLDYYRPTKRIGKSIEVYRIP